LARVKLKNTWEKHSSLLRRAAKKLYIIGPWSSRAPESCPSNETKEKMIKINPKFGRFATSAGCTLFSFGSVLGLALILPTHPLVRQAGSYVCNLKLIRLLKPCATFACHVAKAGAQQGIHAVDQVCETVVNSKLNSDREESPLVYTELLGR